MSISYSRQVIFAVDRDREKPRKSDAREKNMFYSSGGVIDTICIGIAEFRSESLGWKNPNWQTGLNLNAISRHYRHYNGIS